MDTLQENSVMLHINECLYRKGIISQSLYDHAKSVIIVVLLPLNCDS